jgi:hypothetical protein
MTDVLFIITPVFWPFGHFKKAASKVFAPDPLDDLFAPVTSDFDCFYLSHLMGRFSLRVECSIA